MDFLEQPPAHDARIPGAPEGEVAELSDVTLLGLGVRLREEGLGCGEERCCFRRKRGESEGDLLFADLEINKELILSHNYGKKSTEEYEIYTFTSSGKKQVLPFFGCCTADSQTDAGRHQLFINGSLVLFISGRSHR